MPFKLSRGRNNEEVEITAKDVIGMTEDELKANFEKLKIIDELKTAQDTQNTALTSIQTTLAALEGRLPKTKENNNDGGGNDNEEQDPTTRVLNYVTQTALESKIEVVKSRLRGKTETDGSLKYPYWDQFEEDMNKLTEKDPIQQKTLEVYWDNVYSIIFARNYKKIQDGTIKAKRTMFMETGSSMSGGQETNTEDKPTDTDKQQAAKFRIPIEKYMETKKKLKFA
jgi:hypothetical protein